MNVLDLLNGSCQNNGSEDAPPFSLVPYGEIATINGGKIFTFTKSTTDFKRDAIVTGPGLISKTSPTNFGDCQVGGLVIVKWSGSTPAVNEELGMKPDDWTANAGYPGCVICRGIVDTTLKLMYGFLHPVNELWGMWDGDIAKGAQGTVLISTGNAGWIDSTFSIPNVTNVPADASDGDLVNVSFMNGKPEGYPRECAT